MFAKLTSVTHMRPPNFITLDKRTFLESRHYILTGVSKSLVSEVSGGGDEHGGGWCTMRGAGKRVEVAFTVAAKDHSTSLQVLHRETKGVKLNGTEIVSSKFSNRK